MREKKLISNKRKLPYYLFSIIVIVNILNFSGCGYFNSQETDKQLSKMNYEIQQLKNQAALYDAQVPLIQYLDLEVKALNGDVQSLEAKFTQLETKLQDLLAILIHSNLPYKKEPTNIENQSDNSISIEEQ